MADDEIPQLSPEQQARKVAFDAIEAALADGHARTVLQNVGKPVPEEKNNG